MRLIHSQCGGAVVVDRGVGPEVIKVSTRPGATGTDLLYAVRCSVCKETLGTVPNDRPAALRMYQPHRFPELCNLLCRLLGRPWFVGNG